MGQKRPKIQKKPFPFLYFILYVLLLQILFLKIYITGEVFMNQKFSFFKLLCSFSTVLFFAACSSDSGSNAASEDSSSSYADSGSSSSGTGNSSALVEGTSSSSIEGASSSGTGVSSSAGSITSSSSEHSEGNTNALSTSTWLTWTVPSSPTAGSYTTGDTAVSVTIAESGYTISNQGNKAIAASGNTLYIASSGLYVLSGTKSDGQIRVTVDTSATVELVLNGVMMGNSTNSPIFVERADKVKLELPEGSVNIFSDASSYTFVEDNYFTAADSVPKACIYSRDDMTLKGNGTLYVTGNYANGIHIKADLLVNDDPVVYVNAVKHALKGKGSVIVNGGEFSLKTGDGDAIQSDNESRSDKGYIKIEAGTFTMDVGSDAVNAYQALTVDGGTFNILAGDGSLDTSVSHKAFKSSVSQVVFNAGTVTVISQGDAIHAPTVSISGGAFNIAAGDDGIQAQNYLYLRGGTGIITKSKKPILTGSSLTVTGGSWLGLGGGYDALMVPTANTAYSAVFELPSEIQSGATVSIKDASGTEVYSATAGKKISSLFATSSSFTTGTYSVYAAGSLVCSFSFADGTSLATSCAQ